MKGEGSGATGVSPVLFAEMVSPVVCDGVRWCPVFKGDETGYNISRKTANKLGTSPFVRVSKLCTSVEK